MNTIISIFIPFDYTFGAKREVRFIYPPLNDLYADVSLPNEAVLDSIGQEPLLIRFSNVVIPDTRTLEKIASGGSIVLYDGNLYSVETVRSRPNDFSISLICKKEERYQPHQFLSLTAGDSLLVAGDDILGTGDPLAGGEIDAPEPSGGAPDTPGTPGRPPTTGSIATDEQIDARVRALVDDRAEAGNSDRWPLSKLDEAVATDDDLPTPRTDEEIDARIATPARAGNTERWDYNKLPTTVAKLSDIPTDGGGGNGATSGLTESEVDARIADQVLDFAEGSKTARAPKSRLPTDTVYDADIENLQTQAQVDARVVAGTKAPARAGNNSRFEEADLPADVVYDSDLTALRADISAANRYKGAWVSGTAYRIGDVVVSGTMFYIAKTARTSANTTAPAQDPEWLDMTAGATPNTGMIVTQTEIDWGDDDIAIPLGAINTASSWVTLSSPTVDVGAHILTFRLLIEETGTAWYGIEYRMRRTRGSVVTTIEETPRIRYNARPTGLTWTDTGGQYQSVTMHFDSQAGDTFQLQARAIADNIDQLNRHINFPADEQYIEMTTMRPAASSAVAIDARIATFARHGATIQIPDAQLPPALRSMPALGTAGQVLQVNSGATALEFADAASGSARWESAVGTITGGFHQVNASTQNPYVWSWTPTSSGTALLFVDVTFRNWLLAGVSPVVTPFTVLLYGGTQAEDLRYVRTGRSESGFVHFTIPVSFTSGTRYRLRFRSYASSWSGQGRIDDVGALFL